MDCVEGFLIAAVVEWLDSEVHCSKVVAPSVEEVDIVALDGMIALPHLQLCSSMLVVIPVSYTHLRAHETLRHL
eukprot:11474607-Ditylum_brightwellii.AAC.1